MNKAKFFEEARKKYPEFWYEGYQIFETETEVRLEFSFRIPNLTEFHPTINIKKKNFHFQDIQSDFTNNLVFQIGLVELISYWKTTCSPKIIIKCGVLNAEQVAWWKKLYYYGLGELLFRNGIKVSLDQLVEIEAAGDDFVASTIKAPRDGYLVLVGGGKDSIVTLETLDLDQKRDYTMIVNPKPVTLECARLAGFGDERIVEIERSIDENLLKLNQQGFINGHTPFSALLAFLSNLICYLLNIKYIVVSNESSANEANVCDEKVNHQYSKSFEFEEDFRAYAQKYLGGVAEYFSFLRPLNELQIAKLFSKLTNYHAVFKSCNVGSKGERWYWCGKCAKCLFAFIILSPYLYRKNLVDIFQKDLFEDKDLLGTFLELVGHGETKPFDCVGTFEEVNFAVSLVIQRLQNSNQELPYLLNYYFENFGLADTSEDITLRFDENNNLNEKQRNLLRKALGI